MAKVELNFEGLGEMRDRIDEFDNKIREVIGQTVEYHTSLAESEAKKNAPWTDRTTNARSGLNARMAQANINNWQLILAHSMYYGIFLETAHSGRYEIIMPTLRSVGQLLMTRLQNTFDLLEEHSE